MPTGMPQLSSQGGGGGAPIGARIRLLGASTSTEAGKAHTVYRISVERGGPLSANSSRLIDLIGRIDSPKRFSSFLDLLTRLAKEVGKTAGHAVIDTWKRQLTIEKRHTGKASRTEQVVNGRIQLLQRLLDELTAVPELANSNALAAFLAAGDYSEMGGVNVQRQPYT